MISEAIYTILTTAPEFSAIAGNRVYPLRVAQGAALPSVAFQTISNNPASCKEGANQDKKRIQINIYSEEYDQVEALAEICRTLLDGFSGTVAETSIAGITYESETDLHDNAAEIYFKAQDYTITINR
jgi:hypothetical protein